MNIVVVAAGATAAAMLADWTAVRFGRARVENVAKPLVMLGLIAVLLAGETMPASLRPWLFGALAFGLIGDIFLLPSVDQFLPGLGSFLIGHSLYLVAFILIWDPGPPLLAGAIGIVALISAFARPILRALWGSVMFVPVVAYVGITTAIIVFGAATGRWLIVVGALGFALSDGLLGVDRFVTAAPHRRLWVHMLYHLGQAGIVAGSLG